METCLNVRYIEKVKNKTKQKTSPKITGQLVLHKSYVKH